MGEPANPEIAQKRTQAAEKLTKALSHAEVKQGTKDNLENLKQREEDSKVIRQRLEELKNPNLTPAQLDAIVAAADLLYTKYRPEYLQKWDEFYPKMTENIQKAIDTLTAMGSSTMKYLASFFGPESVTGKILLSLSSTVAAQYAYLKEKCSQALNGIPIDLSREDQKNIVNAIRRTMIDGAVTKLEQAKKVKVTFEEWADAVAEKVKGTTVTDILTALKEAKDTIISKLQGQDAPSQESAQNQPSAVPEKASPALLAAINALENGKELMKSNTEMKADTATIKFEAGGQVTFNAKPLKFEATYRTEENGKKEYLAWIPINLVTMKKEGEKFLLRTNKHESSENNSELSATQLQKAITAFGKGESFIEDLPQNNKGKLPSIRISFAS